jgi:hypothetical protein
MSPRAKHHRHVNGTDAPVGTLTCVCRSLFRWVKRAWQLPQAVAAAVKERRRQIVLRELEVERLDRLRHPSKYQGR